MRLINVKTLELHEFIGSYIPPYTILSHTWGHDEVTFQDMLTEKATTKEGYEKIKRCCEIAASDGFKWAWVDTCCIDKTSSAELSEAINSMYRWYRNSRVCYVILSDVSSEEECQTAGSSFRRSRWFTRGWTLQELIAPSSVIFYGSDWIEIGTKSSMCDLIVEITHIHEKILLEAQDLGRFSVAQKMSWASGRETTRVEDIAYCLMGLFNINMPLLYGEGKRAFFRLQEQILNTSDDDSILAWAISQKLGTQHTSSCLAASPAAFANSGNIIYSPAFLGWRNELGHSTITNGGLHIELDVIHEHADNFRHGTVYGLLRVMGPDRKSRVAIPMLKRKYSQVYCRTESDAIELFTNEEIQRRGGYQRMLIYIEVDRELDSNYHWIGKDTRVECNVETKGLQENGIIYVGLSQPQRRLDAAAPTFCWFVGEQDTSATVHFHGRNIDSFFKIVLTHRYNSFMHRQQVGICVIHEMQGHEGFWFVSWNQSERAPDRVKWQDSTGRIRIKVAVRAHGKHELTQLPPRHELTLEDNTSRIANTREIDDRTSEGEQTFKVSINWDGPEGASSYEPIALENMIYNGPGVEDF